MNNRSKISIAIADDHTMLRKGLIKLLTMQEKYSSLFDVDNGEQVMASFKKFLIPDILILDVNMEGKNGIDTAKWVNQHYPFVKILALSMYNDEETILKMLQAGAHGYLTKNSEPEKLKIAIDTLFEKGYYLPEHLSHSILSGLQNNALGNKNEGVKLTDKEKQYLSLLCKEMTSAEIAERMFLSIRTIEDYRKKLAKKLNVKGKSGLIVYATRNQIK